LDIGDAAWAEISGLLPAEQGRQARPAQDNRRYLNGMLHVLRTGCPWRLTPARYGKWNSIYVRFRRWSEQGVWEGLLVALARLGLTDDWRREAAASLTQSARARLIERAARLRADLGPSQLRLCDDHAAYLKSEIVPPRKSSSRPAALDKRIAT
jgi:transposase